MESELDINKEADKATDSGFSEKKLALQVDQGVPSKPTARRGNTFIVNQPIQQVTQQTVFQAQKKQEK